MTLSSGRVSPAKAICGLDNREVVGTAPPNWPVRVKGLIQGRDLGRSPRPLPAAI